MANNAPVIPGAVMLDAILEKIQTALVDNLSWLDVAFGRAQRITRKGANGQTYRVPNVYCGGWNGHGPDDYIEVSPDSNIGNFSWFDITDPATIEPSPWARTYSVPFALVVWFDLRRVYGQANNRNTELLKAQIIKLINGRQGWHLTDGRVEILRVYEQAENIYKGYSLNEVDNQFLMHPFGGFRFEGTLIYDELCKLENE